MRLGGNGLWELKNKEFVKLRVLDSCVHYSAARQSISKKKSLLSLIFVTLCAPVVIKLMLYSRLKCLIFMLIDIIGKNG